MGVSAARSMLTPAIARFGGNAEGSRSSVTPIVASASPQHVTLEDRPLGGATDD
jgi:hypothetical protein